MSKKLLMDLKVRKGPINTQVVKYRFSNGSPVTPSTPKQPNGQTSALLVKFLELNKLSKYGFLLFNLFQTFILLYCSNTVYCTHVEFVHQYTKGNFSTFVISMLPGLITLPTIVSLIMWPTFCIFRLVLLKDEFQVDSVQNQIDIFRTIQSIALGLVLDYSYKKRRKAFDLAIGNQIPFDIKWRILRTLDNDHEFYRQKTLNPLIKQRKRRNAYLGEWNRVMVLWSLFTGIRDEYGIPTHISLKIRGFNVFVFCRDGFLVSVSCLLRFTLIIWITS